VEDRQKGYYNPIVGGMPVPVDYGEEAVAPLPPTPAPAQAPTNRARSTSNPGRPAGSKTLAKTTYSVSGIKDIADATNHLFNFMSSEAKQIFKKKRLNKTQKQMLERVCESVVVAKDMEDWEATAAECIKNPNKIVDLQPMSEILNISSEHELDDYAAAILYHSRKNSLEA